MKLTITEQQLHTFNQNFKLCLAQTTTTFYTMKDYLELDDFKTPKGSPLSQDNWQKLELDAFHIDEYEPNSSDVDHEIYSIETKYGEHVYLVETMGDVYDFIKDHMNSTLRNENYFPKETEMHLIKTTAHQKPQRSNKPYQPVTHI